MKINLQSLFFSCLLLQTQGVLAAEKWISTFKDCNNVINAWKALGGKTKLALSSNVYDVNLGNCCLSGNDIPGITCDSNQARYRGYIRSVYWDGNDLVKKGYQRLKGTIPKQLATLGSVTYCHPKDPSFCTGGLHELVLVNNNNLTGPIPANFGQNKFLQVLLLNNNPKLYGTLKPSCSVSIVGLRNTPRVKLGTCLNMS